MQLERMRIWIRNLPPWVHTAAAVWLLVGTAIATVVGSLYFKTAAEILYSPVVIESVAWIPKGPSQGLHVFDGRTVHQHFIPHIRTIASLEIGLVNTNNAPDDAQVTVTIADEHNNTVYKSIQPVSFWHQHSLTELPVKTPVEPGQPYWITITTNGVEKGKDITLAYNSNTERYPEGKLHINEQTGDTITQKDLQGNIGFQIIQDLSSMTIWKHILHSPAGYIGSGAVGIWGIGAFLIIVLTTRKQSVPRRIRRICKPVQLEQQRIDWKDIALATSVGLVMALFVTFPFYTSLEKTSVFGDVHRALVYRGVARDALIEEGRMGLWEPYMCGGAPLLANSESAQLDPLFLLTLVFGENLGLRLSVTSMLVIGFSGAYILARRFTGAGRIISLAAGAIFAFSGFQMLGYANGAYAWLPAGWIAWYFLFLLMSFRRLPVAMVGGITLACMFFGGGIHMLAWSAVAGGIFALISAILYRNTYPLLAYTLSVMTMLSIAAIKIIPGIEMQTITSIPAEFERPLAFIPPLDWIYRMFADRSQLTTEPWFFEPADDYFRWFDFGSYIGILPITLGIIGLHRIRKNTLLLSIVLTTTVTLLLTFGLPPWNILVQAPPLDEILRNPQRARAVFVLFLGLLAAIGGTHLTHTIPQKRIRSILPVIFSLVILIDLATFHRHLFFKTYTLDIPQLENARPFERVTYSYTNQTSKHHKTSYINYLANQGVTDSCLPFMLPFDKFTAGTDQLDKTKLYQGEAWLLTNDAASLKTHSVNTFEIAANPSENTWLTVNTNYFPGWRTVPERTVRPLNNLLAAQVSESDTNITFIYDPLSYKTGRAITLLSVGVMLVWLSCLIHMRTPDLKKKT